MENLFKALERTSSEFIDGYPTGNVNVGMTWEEHSAIKQALLELKAIKEAKPSEALKKLDDISYLVLNEIDDLKNKELWKSYFTAIRQYILRAQGQETDKELLKNLYNTKVKVPLVTIFNGLPQEKRFAYTEHIYYHWQEMRESFEAEIESLKTEKENLELNAQKQKRALEIIEKKGLPLGEIKMIKQSKNYEKYVINFSWANFKNISIQKNQEEFELLKHYFEKDIQKQ